MCPLSFPEFVKGRWKSVFYLTCLPSFRKNQFPKAEWSRVKDPAWPLIWLCWGCSGKWAPFRMEGWRCYHWDPGEGVPSTCLSWLQNLSSLNPIEIDLILNQIFTWVYQVCISYFPDLCDKILDRNNIRENRCISAEFQGISVHGSRAVWNGSFPRQQKFTARTSSPGGSCKEERARLKPELGSIFKDPHTQQPREAPPASRLYQALPLKHSITSCWVFISVSMTNTPDKKQLWEERVSLACISRS